VGHHFAAGAKHEIESFAKNKGAAGSRGWFWHVLAQPGQQRWPVRFRWSTQAIDVWSPDNPMYQPIAIHVWKHHLHMYPHVFCLNEMTSCYIYIHQNPCICRTKNLDTWSINKIRSKIIYPISWNTDYLVENGFPTQVALFISSGNLLHSYWKTVYSW
jgi:hypothetical protein